MTAYCTFFLQDQWYGVEAGRVQEILRPQDLTPVPLAPDSLGGMLNLRGQILMAVDLRRRLGMPAREGKARAMSLIVRTPDGPVGFQVDQVGDVVEAGDLRPAPLPSNLGPAIRDLADKVFMFEEKLLIALDPARMGEF